MASWEAKKAPRQKLEVLLRTKLSFFQKNVTSLFHQIYRFVYITTFLHRKLPSPLTKKLSFFQKNITSFCPQIYRFVYMQKIARHPQNNQCWGWICTVHERGILMIQRHIIIKSKTNSILSNISSGSASEKLAKMTKRLWRLSSL